MFSQMYKTKTDDNYFSNGKRVHLPGFWIINARARKVLLGSWCIYLDFKFKVRSELVYYNVNSFNFRKRNVRFLCLCFVLKCISLVSNC